MALIDGLIALGVIAAVGYVVFYNMIKKNPAWKEKIKIADPDNLMRKPTLEIPDKIEQVYDEKRAMM